MGNPGRAGNERLTAQTGSAAAPIPGRPTGLWATDPVGT
jgi:hypothetical protein